MGKEDDGGTGLSFDVTNFSDTERLITLLVTFFVVRSPNSLPVPQKYILLATVKCGGGRAIQRG